MNRLLVPLLIAVLAALAVSAAARWVPRRGAARAITSGSTAAPTRQAEDRAMGAARVRDAAAVVFAAAMFLILFRPSVALSGTVGFALALNLGLAASAGLLMFSALPPARTAPRRGRDRAASVPGTAGGPRAPGPTNAPQRISRRGAAILPGAAALAFIAFLVATGLASSADDGGHHRVFFVSAPGTMVEAQFPGWFYGVPLMLVAVALAGSTYAALHRIASAPALPDPRMAGLDRRWREISATATRRFGLGALLCYFGATALLAGGPMAAAANAATRDGAGPLEPLFALGVATAGAGTALAVAGVVLLVLSARGALTIRTAVRAPARGPGAGPGAGPAALP